MIANDMQANHHVFDLHAFVELLVFHTAGVQCHHLHHIVGIEAEGCSMFHPEGGGREFQVTSDGHPTRCAFVIGDGPHGRVVKIIGFLGMQVSGTNSHTRRHAYYF